MFSSNLHSCLAQCIYLVSKISVLLSPHILQNLANTFEKESYSSTVCIMPLQVQIDPAYKARELLHSLKKSGVKVLVCSEFYKTNSCYQIVRTVVPELDSCPEFGVQVESANVPSLQSVIIISDKQYR